MKTIDEPLALKHSIQLEKLERIIKDLQKRIAVLERNRG